MQPLTPQLLAANAYRTLGLSASASQGEIEGAARRMRIWADPTQIPPTPWDLAAIGPVRRVRSDIEQAVSRLREPESRLEERLLWYFSTHPPRGLGRLADGDGTADAPRLARRHDEAIAVIHHACFAPNAAFDISRWKRLLQLIVALSQSPECRQWLVEVESAGAFEKRASLDEIAQTLNGWPAATLGLLSTRIEAALKENNLSAFTELAGLLSSVQGSGDPLPVFDAMIDRLETHLHTQCEQFDEQLRPQLRTNFKKPLLFHERNYTFTCGAEPFYWEKVQPAIEALTAALKEGDPRLTRARSHCALELALLGLGWEWSGEYVRAQETLAHAMELARVSSGRSQIARQLERIAPLVDAQRKRALSPQMRAAERQRAARGNLRRVGKDRSWYWIAVAASVLISGALTSMNRSGLPGNSSREQDDRPYFAQTPHEPAPMPSPSPMPMLLNPRTSLPSPMPGPSALRMLLNPRTSLPPSPMLPDFPRDPFTPPIATPQRLRFTNPNGFPSPLPPPNMGRRPGQ